MSGGLSLTSSDGDNINGSLDKLDLVTLTSNINEATDLGITFSGKLGSTDVLNGKFTASKDLSSYDASKVKSATNQPKESAVLTLNLAGNTSLVLTMTPVNLTTRDMSLKLTAGGNFVTISGQQVYDSKYFDWSMPGNAKIVSSSGDFSAESKASNNSFNGDLKKGNTVIGKITNNVVSVNGSEMSLY